MQFMNDYIISWDFSNGDFPIVSISRLKSNKKSTSLTCEVLDVFHENTGVVSLYQLIEEFERKEREKQGERTETK